MSEGTAVTEDTTVTGTLLSLEHCCYWDTAITGNTAVNGDTENTGDTAVTGDTATSLETEGTGDTAVESLKKPQPLETLRTPLSLETPPPSLDTLRTLPSLKILRRHWNHCRHWDTGTLKTLGIPGPL